MKILVLNAGSSSLKFQLIDMETTDVLAKGNVEKINDNGSFLKYKANGQEQVFNAEIKTHAVGLKMILDALVSSENGVIKSLDEVSAFGHRVVNCGDRYYDSIVLTPEIVADMETKIDYAPLHDPAAISGIKSAMELCPEKPNVAVFDIGFHKTLPDYVYRYAIPSRYYDEYKIRKYGAHGTSHKFVTHECAKLLNKDVKDINIVTCHIGGGASITAVKNGESYDTSMGFTPLEGVIMNTRSGDIDPAVVDFISKKESKTAAEVVTMLNKASGLQGMTGYVSDMRDILANMSDPKVKLAYETYAYRISKYIASYIGVLGGVDAIVFTAGVGENTQCLREDVLKTFEFMGIKVDHEKNYALARGAVGDISTADSKVRVYVIPTNEELVIAQDTLDLIKK